MTAGGAASASAAAQDSIAQWRAATEAGDADAAAAALAENVILVSPLTDQFAFEGKQQVRELLKSVFEVMTGIRFSAQVGSGTSVVLSASATVRGRSLDESQHLELDADGLIVRITLYMRPLPAVTALLRGLGPRVARRQGRSVVAAVLRPAGALLDTVASSGDSTFMPLARPGSSTAPAQRESAKNYL
jgi:ketosteroid isomerase-like protein